MELVLEVKRVVKEKENKDFLVECDKNITPEEQRKAVNKWLMDNPDRDTGIISVGLVAKQAEN